MRCMNKEEKKVWKSLKYYTKNLVQDLTTIFLKAKLLISAKKLLMIIWVRCLKKEPMEQLFLREKK